MPWVRSDRTASPLPSKIIKVQYLHEFKIYATKFNVLKREIAPYSYTKKPKLAN